MDHKILSMNNIYKSFGEVSVLKGVHLNLYAGEVMALMGENGAGKSTLMKILSGIERYDTGTIRVSDEEYLPGSIQDAENHGIVMIQQELNLFDELTVLDNVFLGGELMKNPVSIDYHKQYQELNVLFEQLNISINPKTYVKNLSIGQKQLIEIVKALRKQAKILVMDEPTSALSEEEINRIFNVIESLKEKGVAVIYISHRMQEIYNICDRVTILRDGEFIGEYELSLLSEEELIEHMVGRNVSDPFPYLAVDHQTEILAVNSLQGDFIRDVSFTLNCGEILGVGGLMGSGRTSLARYLYGYLPLTSGSIRLLGESVILSHPKDALKHQIVYISEDRKNEGLWLNFSIKKNISMASIDLLTNKLGHIHHQKEQDLVWDFMKLTKVKSGNTDVLVSTLSGGNQQKVAIARALLAGPRILILDEPTRGIDIGARREIYTLINEFKNNGAAIILISSDMPELLALSDRILVMSEGKMTGILSFDEKSPENVMRLAVNL